MISKIFDIKKNINYNFFLFHGQNIGQKNEIIEQHFKPRFSNNIFSYFEKDILSNLENFNNEILSGSFFEDKKLILIKDATDKIKDIIDDLYEKKIQDISIILISNILDRKSKLRNFFEKEKNLIAVAFYPDNELTLLNIAKSFFATKKISISQETLNLLISRASGDRNNLLNELSKIESYSINKNKINLEELYSLTNLSENFNISELVDNCLAKNKRKTVNILVENNFGHEDCVIITRIFLNKLKKILKLSIEYKKNKDVNLTISLAKPPIFWKEKEITKQQILSWNPENIRKLLYKVNNIELLVKKNYESSINIITDFILDQVSNKVSN